MALVTIFLLGGAGFPPAPLVNAAWAQQPPPEYPWTGKTAAGTIITREELTRLLADQNQGPTAAGKEGKRADQKGTDLTKANLSGVNLPGVNLLRPNLSGADLRESDLSGAYLFDANLSGTDLSKANLKDAVLFRANLREADLREANLEGAGLSMADLAKANLSGANLQKASLRANLYRANLRRANLMKANLRRSNLGGANFSGADLSGADLRDAVLVQANFRNANLSGANLGETELGGADLSGADLAGADLSGADLRYARLFKANLRDAKLSGVNLRGADLSGVVFEPLPSALPPIGALANARGLAELWYVNFPQSLVNVRKSFKEAGYRQQEREITCSLKRSDTFREWRQGGVDRVKAALKFVFFDLTCNYGLSLWRPLALWALGVLIFFPFYCLAFLSRRADTGIWLLWPPDRVLKGEGQEQPEKLTTTPRFPPPATGRWARFWWHLRRVGRILYLGFYFSLVSALSLSWREPNAGSIISRLQKKEYVLRPTGWVRTLAGIQSLISAFLLVLWAFLYLTSIIGEK
jgi:uncharacterized protein YjbI with pentapeptide repeats